MTDLGLKIISADDHVLEPPTLWEDWISKKFVDRAPRVVKLPRGQTTIDEMGRKIDRPGTDGPLVDYWEFEGIFWGLTRQFAAAGFSAAESDDTHVTYETIRPGCYIVKDRLSDMDINNIEASMCFPNYIRFAGQRFADIADKKLGLACIRAYNDWMVEEWSGSSGGRLIPLCIVPLWDAELAAQEVRRNAARGVRAVCFTELPQNLGLPTIHSGHWDPFFKACNDTATVVAIHIGSGTKPFVTSPEAPHEVRQGLYFVHSAASLAEYLCSDILVRFPDLKLFYAESQVGWIPYLLERLDDTFDAYPFRHAAGSQRPSTKYRGRVFSCIFKDHVGARLLDLIGEDQVMFEADYPHGDGTWPDTSIRAKEILAAVEAPIQEKILRTNAISLFGLSLPMA